MTKIKIKIEKDFEDILPSYLSDKKLDLRIIEKAIKENDFKKIQLLAHRIAGTSGCYGLDTLGELGGLLESASNTKDKELIVRTYSNLKDYMLSLEIIYI